MQLHLSPLGLKLIITEELLCYRYLLIYVFPVHGCFVHMYICTTEEDIESYGTAVIDSCELPYRTHGFLNGPQDIWKSDQCS